MPSGARSVTYPAPGAHGSACDAPSRRSSLKKSNVALARAGPADAASATAAKAETANAARQRGHLDYMNHVTGAHLNCTVDTVTFLSATAANFSGTCTANSASPTFSAHVEDNDKTTDKFIVTYGPTEGGTITHGNINIK